MLSRRSENGAAHLQLLPHLEEFLHSFQEAEVVSAERVRTSAGKTSSRTQAKVPVSPERWDVLKQFVNDHGQKWLLKKEISD